MFLKVDGYTILTDPVFSDRVGIELGPVTVGIKRLVSPALQPEDLPHPNLILLSHAHMDHFDRPLAFGLWGAIVHRSLRLFGHPICCGFGAITPCRSLAGVRRSASERLP